MGRRLRFLLLGVLAAAVLVGGGWYLARGVFSAAPAAGGTSAGGTAANARTTAASADEVAVAAPPAVVTVPPRRATAHPAKTGPSPSPSPSASSSSPRPTATAGVGEAPGTPPASAPSTGASAPAIADGTAAAQVLALINQARATAGLPALTVAAGLTQSSSAHNALMAGGCGLSHQCPDEPAIGQRETDAGVDWTAAGENIGDGGPVADTNAAIAQLAVGLTQSMLDEQPPNDGHRMNILSSTFTHIGIAVERDSAGTVWLTQDFSN
jgi:uncharacterized protein YkwD